MSQGVLLVQGPPGTGKTSTISAIMCICATRKHRAHLCSGTNVAVTEVCRRALREIRYGVRIGFAQVDIAPWGAPPAWRLWLGNVKVEYAPTSVNISVPGTGSRRHVIGGLPPATKFAVHRSDGTAAAASSDGEGTLRFEAQVGPNCTTRAVAQVCTAQNTTGRPTVPCGP